jgi:hypothetical protein
MPQIKSRKKYLAKTQRPEEDSLRFSLNSETRFEMTLSVFSVFSVFLCNLWQKKITQRRNKIAADSQIFLHSTSICESAAKIISIKHTKLQRGVVAPLREN